MLASMLKLMIYFYEREEFRSSTNMLEFMLLLDQWIVTVNNGFIYDIQCYILYTSLLSISIRDTNKYI